MFTRALFIPLLTVGAASLSAQGTTRIPVDVIRKAAKPGWIGTHVLVTRPGASTIDSVPAANGVTISKGDVVVVPAKPHVPTDTGGGTVHLDSEKNFVLLGAENQILTLRLRVSFSETGLRYIPGGNVFSGEVAVMLEDVANPSSQVMLGRAIDVAVTGGADSYDPTDFVIDHTNLPYKRIKVSLSRPVDTIGIVIKAVFDTSGSRFAIPVQRPLVQVFASQPLIQGLGLQTTQLTVQMTDGPRGIPVIMVAGRGKIADDTLKLSEAGIGVTSVRSEWIGDATVHAIVGHYARGEVTLRYGIPFAFGIAALLGGIVGTLIRRRLEDTAKRKAASDLILGMVFGLFGAIAYAIGVNLFGVDLKVHFGEAVTFVAAGLSAALLLPGVALLLAKKTPA